MTRRTIGAALAILLTGLAAALAGPVPASAEDPPIQRMRFQSASSSKCLNVLFPGYLIGSPTLQFDCASSVVVQRELTADGNGYFLVIAGPTLLCLEAQGYSTPNVAQAWCGSWQTQWRFVPSGYTGTSALSRWLAASFMIQNVYSGKCLEISGNSQDNGALVVQSACTRALNQLWFDL
jgi:hypothetical protein